MALRENSEAYQALVNIVGSENITTDPVFIDTYLWQWLADLVGEKANAFMPIRPEAIVLPGSTGEVQAIVRVCNRYGLKFKAHSTGWVYVAAPLSEQVIILDLRRMNRILEINTKDMYAVVEPYVSGAQLQAEIMRKGFNCEINAAGSNTSVLAQACAGFGAGYGNYQVGYGSGTVQGVEWVLPDGELLEMGSLGSGCGWVSPEGPGPGLKGVMRGHLGTMGGCGVFTKCAIRIYHWPGPPELELENITPGQVRIKEYPENIALYFLYFEDYESRQDALCSIGEEDLGYVLGFVGRGLATMSLGDTNSEAVALRENLFDALPSISFSIVLAAGSTEELDYQKKVLEQILEDTGGKIMHLLGQPPFLDTFTTHYIKVGSLAAHGVCGRTGAFLCSPASAALSRRLVGPVEALSIEVKKRFIESGQLVDDGGEGTWGVIWDHSHETYIENLVEWDPTDPESVQGHIDLQTVMNKETLEKLNYYSALGAWVEEIGQMKGEDLEKLQAYTASDLVDPDKRKELAKLHSPYDANLGPLLGDFHVWMRKIRARLDPNNVGDATPI